MVPVRLCNQSAASFGVFTAAGNKSPNFGLAYRVILKCKVYIVYRINIASVLVSAFVCRKTAGR